ncbi:recombination directionality factor [Kitasatospora sp. NPDC003701]
MLGNMNVFDTDPDARPKERKTFADDYVGRFRAGKQIEDTPVSLAEWRITTGDPSVGKAVHELFGGEAPAEWETKGEDGIEVLTAAKRVSVVIDGPDALYADMRLYGPGGLFHHCTGTTFLDDDRKGEPCGCPALLAERKDQAKRNRGPKPNISIKFRLADDPDLGVFRYVSSSWALLGELFALANSLDKVGGPALATLELELIEFVPKRGPMAGKQVSYTAPKVTVHKAWETAITEPPKLDTPAVGATTYDADVPF